ncbi:MAG: 2-C-methyl-D-erythritol 4-phosphate cytidylyltransferase [Verrucomicrobiia bacterium]
MEENKKNRVKTGAIIVGAGKGTRMGGVDKLFINIAGKPVIAHTILKFEGCSLINEIVLVIRPEQEPLYKELLPKLNLSKPCRITYGGAARQDSVWNGLQSVSEQCEIVAIHDGARPCVSEDLIERVIQFAIETGAAVAAKRIIDTIKESNDGIHIGRTLDRSRLWSVQTPQCFRLEVIRKAIENAKSLGLELTDDTAACELIGQKVRLVEYQEPNPKLTLPSDIPYIQFLLSGAVK